MKSKSFALRAASYRFPLFIAAVIFLTGLALQASADDGAAFAAKVGQAHGIDIWQSKSAVAARIQVDFNGRTVVKGRLLFETTGGRARLELEDGSVVVFDGQDAWTSPADSKFQGARFHVLTWPYFLAAPMKLADPGANLDVLGPRPFDAKRQFPAAKLTFDQGVGDSPEDWYVVYFDEKNQKLAGMAYIVTFGTDVSKAEEEPHVIVYENVEEIDGVSLSSHWSFWNWNEEQGIFGDPIGKVVLEDLRFVEPASNAFARPQNARPELLPAP